MNFSMHHSRLDTLLLRTENLIGFIFLFIAKKVFIGNIWTFKKIAKFSTLFFNVHYAIYLKVVFTFFIPELFHFGPSHQHVVVI